jgi:hypothetical protein
MKLKRFLLRYFPPGIILEYETNGETKQKTVDLLDLNVDTDAEVCLPPSRDSDVGRELSGLCAHQGGGLRV